MSEKPATGVVVRNIYYMMAYAFRVLNLEEYARLATEDFDGVEDLMAAILTIGIDSQRRRGLERAYTPVHEDVGGLRGRVDARRTSQHRALGAALVACEWDELTEDTYKNRILKTVGLLLVSSELVSQERRQRLKRALLALRDVGSLDPLRIEWGRLRYHRNNASYQFLMNVCYMVVTSMLLTEDGGASKLAMFKDPQKLYTLYEHFVLEWFCKHHPELSPTAKTMPRVADGDAPSFLPQLITDVTLSTGDRTLIIDCKCYGKILNTHHGKEIASPAHLNQIFAYVMHEAYEHDGKVSGMLLYALTDRDEVQDVRWSELGHDYYLWTLDLGQEFAAIAERLESVAGLA